MSLGRIDIGHFRCLSEESFRPSANINVFTGQNGSGKTSILEALYMLGTAKSFRTSKIRDVIQHGHRSLCISADSNVEAGRAVRLGFEWSVDDGARLRFDEGKSGTVSELARRLPTILLTPDTHVEFFSSPKARRRMMDMALFHVKHEYFSVWKKYHLALRCRNRLLRQNAGGAEIKAWNAEISVHGQVLHRHRQEFLEELSNIVIKMESLSTDAMSPSVVYLPGWDTEYGLCDALDRALHVDLVRGHTSFGPHRGDLVIKINGKAVEKYHSRGQLKVIAFKVYIAVTEFIRANIGTPPLLLIDDFFADLDIAAREKMILEIVNLDIQSLLTAVEAGSIPRAANSWMQMFHVERGVIREAA